MKDTDLMQAATKRHPFLMLCDADYERRKHILLELLNIEQNKIVDGM